MLFFTVIKRDLAQPLLI